MKRIKLDEKKLFLASVFVLYLAGFAFIWAKNSLQSAFLFEVLAAALALCAVLFVRKNGLQFLNCLEHPKLIVGLLALLLCVAGVALGEIQNHRPWLGVCLSAVYCLALYGAKDKGLKGLMWCMFLAVAAVAFQTNFVFQSGANVFLIVVLVTTALAISRDWFSQKERTNQLMILALGLVLAVALGLLVNVLLGGDMRIFCDQFFVSGETAQSVSLRKILAQSAPLGQGNPAVLSDQLLSACLSRVANPLVVIAYYLGWIPAVLVMALFCVLIGLGFRLALKKQCPNGFLLLTGVTLLTANLLFMLLTDLGAGYLAYQVPFFQINSGMLIPALLLAGYCRLDLPLFRRPQKEQEMLTVIQGPAGSGKTQFMKAVLHRWQPYGAYVTSEVLYDRIIEELKESGELSGDKRWAEAFPELEERSIQILAIDDVDMKFQGKTAAQSLLAEIIGQLIDQQDIHVMVAGVEVEKNLPQFIERLKALGIAYDRLPKEDE